MCLLSLPKQLALLSLIYSADDQLTDYTVVVKGHCYSDLLSTKIHEWSDYSLTLKRNSDLMQHDWVTGAHKTVDPESQLYYNIPKHLSLH